ncbi:TrkH family potassium uptake protein [Methanofollis ethanolicus]|uniref:TrkH family potassium uptake protein n=1 Tax=Methanofollis ethanolicus TaxID=488124 RepID=UPI000831F026|nr:TrkH family potassium uptake protein [Methanofollis ethanolicus]
MRGRDQIATILPDMGRIFLLIGLVCLTPLLVGVIYREWSLLPAMATAPLAFFIIGGLLSPLQAPQGEAHLSVAIAAVACIWFVCALIGAFPFMVGHHMPFTDSVFEAMSGWTDTGLTLITDVDKTPKTLLFWRSFMQWLGGIGIVAFTVALSRRSGTLQRGLYRYEGRSESLMPGVVATAANMWQIYILITALSTALILLSGVSLWDAVNIAMTSLATGGFSVHTAGISYYNNVLLEMLVVPVMLAGALPFKLYYLMIHSHRRVHILKDPQARVLFLLVATGTLVTAFDLVTKNLLDIPTALRQSLFMVTSAITCTGFQNANPFEWTGATVLFITLLMLIGGSSGSTSGGMKIGRIITGFDGLVWWFRRIFHSSRAIVPFRYEGRIIPHRVAEFAVAKTMLTIFLFIFTGFLASLILLHLQAAGPFEVADVIFEAVSAMCNVGLSTGFANPEISPVSKWLFIFLMWFGRLEMVPVIVLAVGAVRGFD